jgi:hypothetical protein
MYNPESFNERLQEVFHGRLRCRYSTREGEFHIEQKVAPGQILRPPKRKDGSWDKDHDGYIRARDGYVFVMRVRPGTKMPCPTCGLTLQVPVMETREITCEHCRLKGRDARVAAAFFPLGETLIEHLRKMDPESDGVRRMMADVLAAEAAKPLQQERAISNAIAEGIDGVQKSVLFDAPQVGYTGREFTGHVD